MSRDTYLIDVFILAGSLKEGKNLKNGENQRWITHKGREGSNKAIEVFEGYVPGLRHSMGA